MRLSVAQARQLGLKMPATKKKAAKGGTSKGARASRQAVIDYEGEAVEIRIKLEQDPRPKERPRTVVNFEFLKSAFLAAKGNLSRFLSILNDRRETGGRLMVTYTPDGTRKYEDMIKARVVDAFGGREPFTCPVRVDLIFILRDDTPRWPVSQADGDADNLEKAVLDGLNHVAFTDDRLVVVTQRRKITGPSPAILIKISPATPASFSDAFEADATGL